MFDIGFTELLLCLVVALVVIGPEQLPDTVRTLGLWIGRLKRSLRDTRAEIERQLGADDIRRQLHNEEIMRSLEEARKSMERSILAGEQEVPALERPPVTPAETDATGPSSTGSTEAAAPERPRYGPPEELPDHAHLNEPVPTESLATTPPDSSPDSAKS